MGSKNDGLGMGPEFCGRQPGQDRKDFPLGTSPAVPAPEYFADVAGVANEQVIADGIAGLTSQEDIQEALIQRFQNYYVAREYMRRRMGMKI